MMNFPLLAYIEEISPRPILFVVGDRAHSRFFSENAYAAAAEPKEMVIVEDAEHIDLYDRTDRIPFEKLAVFFSIESEIRKGDILEKGFSFALLFCPRIFPYRLRHRKRTA